MMVVDMFDRLIDSFKWNALVKNQVEYKVYVI